MLTLFLALAADPVSLTSKIEDVTVYPTTALVHRAAQAPGKGSHALRGLPQALDEGSVRVRCDAGVVIGVEVRQRLQEAAPSERVEALRQRLESARADVRAAEDQKTTLEALEKHLYAILRVDEIQQREDARNGRPAPDAWEASWGFATRKLTELKGSQREAERALAEKQRAVAQLEKEIGELQGRGPTLVQDVLVDLDAPGATRVDVEYFVSGTGWQPVYDLRTASDVSKVALTYRAKVWQRSGEDWKDVKLALSTAQPQRGAQGPEPEPVWVSLRMPSSRFESGLAAPKEEALAAAKPAKDAERLRGLGYAGDDKDAGVEKLRREAQATVESQGLSVRFQIPRAETVQSRDDSSTVLVGEAQLDVTPERWCVPALDTTVWLRGRAKNTSPWVLLPGAATVFIGQDYLGQANLELVQTGQDLTLHLGADPAVTVERTRTQDMAEGPGFLGSRASKIDGWRVHLENHGAKSARPDGSVEVIVREVLPRSRDERVEVELSKAEPKPSSDERWKKDREEKGFVTWVVKLAPNAKADVAWESTILHPKDAKIVFE
jgi:uncharacterized protein (TIGR02231 family)